MAKDPSREKRKEEERELIARAREERIANAEKRGEISPDEVISDLIRVSRLHVGIGPSSSRQRYRSHGHYSETIVSDLFGTHQEFRRAAGLIDGIEESALKRTIAAARRTEEVTKYANKYLRPWIDKFKGRPPTDEMRVLVGSDFHSQYTDPFALECFILTAQETQPHVIVLAGDLVEFYAASSHPKRPGMHLGMQAEIDFVRREIIRKLREACPDSQIDWHIGNHEDRLCRMLASVGPSLAELDCLQFDRLFNLEGLEINLVFGDSFLASDKRSTRTALNECWKVYGGCFVVTHHTPSGLGPGRKQLERFGMSGCSGHVHRQDYYIEPSLAAPHKDWLVLGMMASSLVGRTYVSRPNHWSNGFGLATVLPDRGYSIQELATIKSGVCLISGMRFDETDEAAKARRWQRDNL